MSKRQWISPKENKSVEYYKWTDVTTCFSHKVFFPHVMILNVIYFVSSVSCLKIIQNEDNTYPKVTTLYPVENITYYVKETNNEEKDNLRPLTDNTTTTTENSLQDKPKTKDYLNSDTVEEVEHTNKIKFNNDNKTDEMNDKISQKNLLIDTTSWKINATYTRSKLDESKDKNRSISDNRLIENESKGKEFKPSPYLGNFFDENEFVYPTQAVIGTYPVNEASTFFGSPRDFFKLDYRHPTPHRDQIETPFRFENIPRTKDWKFETGLEQRPTEEVPVKIPAGGLYKLPDAFKEKPSSDGDSADFGLDFNDAKDASAKKRGNPWKKLLNLVTALLPAGLIISALTPNIITLHNTGNNQHFPSRISRRSEESLADLPPISERCKRRLLCEIHADDYYISDPSRPHRKNLCYKIPCNDPQALSKVLRWLLRHHRGYHILHDRRGFIT